MSILSWFTDFLKSVEKEVPVAAKGVTSKDISAALESFQKVIDDAKAAWNAANAQEEAFGLAITAEDIEKLAGMIPPLAAWASTAEASTEAIKIIIPFLIPAVGLVKAAPGSWVPSTNSKYDPLTGVFLDGPFSNL